MFLGTIVQVLRCSYGYCYLSFAVIFFSLIYLFVTAKAALPKNVLKKLSGLGNVKPINKVIGSTKSL